MAGPSSGPAIRSPRSPSTNSIDLDIFTNETYTFEAFIDQSCSSVFRNDVVSGGKPEGVQPDQISKLLSTFERLDAQLSSLAKRVDAQCVSLQAGISTEEATLLASVATAEQELGALKSSLSALQSRAERHASFASRVGTHLQKADNQRRRALRAAKGLEHLAAFASCEDLDSLPELFQDENRMAEAAALTSALSFAISRASEDISMSNARDVKRFPGETSLPPPHRSNDYIVQALSAAAEQLELYRNVLDNKVVSRFDEAAEVGNIAGMATCARIMKAAGSASYGLLVSRYVSSRPLFSDPKIVNVSSTIPSGAAEPGREGGRTFYQNNDNLEMMTNKDDPNDSLEDARAVGVMRSLSELYSTVTGALRDEAVIIEQVFPEPWVAIGALTVRVFDQVVQGALEGALEDFTKVTPEALRAHLRLLAEAYRKTLMLAEEAVTLAGPSAGLSSAELADGAFGALLSRYLDLEISWITELASVKLASSIGSTLSRDVVLDLLAINEEAVKRCIILTPPEAIPMTVRFLFHSAETIDQWAQKFDAAAPSSPCLLGQVAMHLLPGLHRAAEACGHRLAGAFRPPSSTSSMDLVAAARADIDGSLGPFLKTIATASDILLLLTSHFHSVISPHVIAVAAATTACTQGLDQLMSSVESRIAAGLDAALQRICRRIDATLAAEQGRSDFRPSGVTSYLLQRTVSSPPTDNLQLDKATDACMVAVALLKAAGEAISKGLHGGNERACIHELARRMAIVIESHALRHTFSMEGALRWLRDLSEYAACLDQLGTRGGGLEDLQALASVLVVAPEGLPGVVDSLGHIDKGRVRALAERREDWRSARLGGVPLTAIFLT